MQRSVALCHRWLQIKISLVQSVFQNLFWWRHEGTAAHREVERQCHEDFVLDSMTRA